MTNDLRKKAERLLALHHAGKLLVLPNIWDVLGAKLLEYEGFPAIATASASVAYSNGYQDGQHISFDDVVGILTRICRSTQLPVTADIERGYANTNDELADNIKRLIGCGVSGINFEDSDASKIVIPIDLQCEKIRLIRKTSEKIGVPLVINARTDVFISKDFPGNKLDEAINRGHQYKDAGADCFYPILCNNDELRAINAEVNLPVNVMATKELLSMDELEKIGIARISLGPALLRSALTKMRQVIRSLKKYEGYETFANNDLISSSEIIEIIKG